MIEKERSQMKKMRNFIKVKKFQIDKKVVTVLRTHIGAILLCSFENLLK